MKYRVLVMIILSCIMFSCKESPVEQKPETTKEVKQWTSEDTRSITGLMDKRGLIAKTDMATPGYVLFQPSQSVETFLIDMDGNVVKNWKGEMNSMQSYLLENGSLVRLERDVDFPTFAAGGQSGRIREYDWDGNMTWDFEYANENELIHHDIEIMPNGNILAISYEVKTMEEAIAAGRNPENIPKAGLWPDKIIEIKPIRPYGGEVVWEWHMWDHLIQDIDSTKNNYGDIAQNPRKININTHSEEGGPPMTKEQIDHMIKLGFMTSNATVENRGSDITHMNAISYNPQLDQIAVSSPGYSEIFIIDHSTSAEEVKGSSGGEGGHGGDLLYRWGNPQNYDAGSKEDQKLFGQHDVKWVPEGYPGAGNLTVFNNDIVHPDNKLPSVWAAIMSSKSMDPQVSIGDLANYSAVYELNVSDAYEISTDGSFGPSEPSWSYIAPDKYSFYSPFVSGAQRLKNGNTMIASGAKGRFFEVTPDNEIVWEYWNPYKHNYRLPDGSAAQPTGPFLYSQFRCTHFMVDYPAFEGRELSPVSPQPEPFVFIPPPPPPPEDAVTNED